MATLLPTKFANLFQRNAASVSAPESAEWFTFQRNFFILKTGATQRRVGVGRQRRTKVQEAGERGTRSRRL